MLRRLSSGPLVPSIDGADQTVSDFAIPCQRILSEARLYWSKGWAKKLAGITGRSPRTCYRWYAKSIRKRRVPDADDIIAIVAALRKEHAERGRIFEQFELQLS